MGVLMTANALRLEVAPATRPRSYRYVRERLTVWTDAPPGASPIVGYLPSLPHRQTAANRIGAPHRGGREIPDASRRALWATVPLTAPGTRWRTGLTGLTATVGPPYSKHAPRAFSLWLAIPACNVEILSRPGWHFHH